LSKTGENLISKIRLQVRALLRELHRRLQPKNENNEITNVFCLNYPLACAKELFEKIGLDENEFKKKNNEEHENAKGLFIYIALSDVLKSAITNMRLLDFIEESEEDDQLRKKSRKEGASLGERVGRAIFESISTEQHLWQRKLQEALCNLILFTGVGDQNYFRLYVAAHELSDALYALRDYEKYFECQTTSHVKETKKIYNLVKTLLSNVAVQDCWFLKQVAELNSFDGVKPSNVLASYASIFDKAILKATRAENTVLGPTYKVGYGKTSNSIHFSVRSSKQEHSFDGLRALVHHTALLNLHILNRAYEVAGKSPSGKIDGILDLIRRPEGAEIGHHRTMVKDFKIGDHVSWGPKTLAEVFEIKTSKYGYKSYKLKYKLNPPDPEILEEWLHAPLM